MNIIEIIAVIFSLLSVVLTIRNNIWCWFTGIIGIIFYSILFYQNQLWGNMSLQVLFISQSMLGWWNWNESSKYPIKWVKPENRQTVIVICILLFLLVSTISKNHGGKMPYFDGITTSLSIMGMVLLAYKKIDAWIFWIIADIIFIYLFYLSGLYLSSIIYSIFLILSILGLLQWRKSIKTD